MRYAGWVFALLGPVLLGQTVVAEPLRASLRPELRPKTKVTVPLVHASAKVLRPQLRPVQNAVPATVKVVSDKGFLDWISGFRQRARGAGISAATFDGAFRGVTYDPEVIRRDRNQSEFTKTIWDYLDSAASDTRIRNGKQALTKHKSLLQAIERQYGVEKEVVLAVWGLESAYGTFKGNDNVIQSLATLAFDGRRGAFFEQQLVAALKILQSGDVSARNMTGSWAGAMGHTQFIPTSYLNYAVDFTGDGKRDIWSDNPADALASTAAYLKRSGWVTGQPWGVEVRLPKGFDYSLADRKIERQPSDWGRVGIVGLNGKTVPNHGKASILLPAGSQGAAFMIFQNFSALEAYNTADAYVIGVGHLSDRIKGGPPIQANWPRGDRALTLSERETLQTLLTRAGFDTQGIDGKIGPLTIDAVRQYQRSQGLVPDGYPSLRLLKRLQ